MLKKYSLYIAWVLSCCGVLASLFFSVMRQLEPCTLCWYQRIALFPMAFLLGMATYSGDKKMTKYILPLAIFGCVFAVYQILIQEIPGWYPIEMCGAGPSCSEKINIGLGFITIPMLSLINFLIIFILLLI